MDDHWYFSYGSNLAIDQKESRTGKIREARRACLAGYRIVFNKVGSDGTGKANIWPDGTRVVWGMMQPESAQADGRPRGGPWRTLSPQGRSG